MTAALYFVLKTLTQLYLLLLILRFWLPMFRADFRNPVAQGVLRLTSPLVVPLRRFIPPIGRIDTSTVLACGCKLTHALNSAVSCFRLFSHSSASPVSTGPGGGGGGAKRGTCPSLSTFCSPPSRRWQHRLRVDVGDGKTHYFNVLPDRQPAIRYQPL